MVTDLHIVYSQVGTASEKQVGQEVKHKLADNTLALITFRGKSQGI